MLRIPSEDDGHERIGVPHRDLTHTTFFAASVLAMSFVAFSFLFLIFSVIANYTIDPSGHTEAEIKAAEGWAKRANEVLNFDEYYGCPLICEVSKPCLKNAVKPPLRLLEGGAETERRLGTYSCPDGCEIPDEYVNDNFCDCPDDCADEDHWTCASCGLANGHDEKVDIGVGVGVGVGTALALGIGLGAGLGTSAAGAVAGAAFAVQGSMRLRVTDPSMLQSPQFARAFKDTISRLAGGIASSVIELAIRQARRLAARQLQQSIDVQFQIKVDRQSAQELGQKLSGYDVSTVQTVLQSELREEQIDPNDVTVEGYQVNPNPLSYNPLNEPDSGTFVAPEGVALG